MIEISTDCIIRLIQLLPDAQRTEVVQEILKLVLQGKVKLVD